MDSLDLSPSTVPSPAVVCVPASAVTLDGFRAWALSDSFPDRGRVTYLEGALIIDMSPEQIEAHAKLKAEVSHVIMGLIKDRDLGNFYPDGTMFTHREAGVSNEPDAMFASWETLASGRLRPPADRPQDGRHSELVGTPDWVCEIVSDSSVAKDNVKLRAAYHRAKIAEYWLIDARRDTIDFQVLNYAPNGYQATPNCDGWLASRVFGCRFRIERVRDRVGQWQYMLECDRQSP